MRYAVISSVPFGIALASFAPSAYGQTAPTPEVADQGTSATAPAHDELLPPEYPSPGTDATVAIAGGAVFAGWYGGALGASLLWSDAPGAKELRYPVVGPWMSLAHTGCADDDRNCSTSTVVLRAVLTVFSGVGQLGGLAALGEGLFLRTEKPRPKLPQATVTGAPFVAGRDGFGLAVVGAF